MPGRSFKAGDAGFVANIFPDIIRPAENDVSEEWLKGVRAKLSRDKGMRRLSEDAQVVKSIYVGQLETDMRDANFRCRCLQDRIGSAGLNVAPRSTLGIGRPDPFAENARWRGLLQIEDQRAIFDRNLPIAEVADEPPGIIMFYKRQDDGFCTVPLIPCRGFHHRPEHPELLLECPSSEHLAQLAA